MPSLPIPLVVALFLAFMFLRLMLSDGRHVPLAVLLRLCAVQALIKSLNQHYGLRGMATLQPATATLIPPAAWIAFRMTAERHPRWRDVVHLTTTAAVPVAWFLHLPAIDMLIPAQFAGYGIAVLWASWRNSDGLVHSILEAGDWSLRIWQIIGVALIASAKTDVLIAVAMETGARHLTPWIISVYSLANLLVVGGLSLSSARVTDSRRP
ncbi:MAG: AraC family transcriptional regulator, partial [Alphaproteobacteria bacterium]|nr:AraC family transcriptional regulator [Alphaproteobacteria bacterium]